MVKGKMRPSNAVMFSSSLTAFDSTVNLEPDPPFWTKTSCLQLGYGVWVNLTVVGIGLAFGFPAVTIPQLLDPDSSIELTMNDEALIASVLTLSAPIGSVICGLIMDRYGRKVVLVLCQLPICVGWFYTGLSMSAKNIIIGRIIAGVGIGMAMSAPRAYITEISLPNMRGVIGALPNIAMSFGIMIQAILGSYLQWNLLCFISGGLTVFLVILNIFLPDTPYFKILTGTTSSTKRTLMKFRSSKFNVDAEINEMNDYKLVNDIRRLTASEQVRALLKPSTCKPFGIVIVYIVFTQGAGVNVVVFWAVEMLESAKSSIDPNLGNFVLAVIRIAFGVLTSILLFKVGRRVLALTSAIGVGLVSVLLGGFMHTTDEVSIYPLMFFTAYIAFATLGYYTLPFLIMFELLPLQVRGVLSGVGISVVNLLMFGMSQIYPTMRNELGLPNTMITYGAISLLGSVFLYFALPETKDLTLPEIEEYFNSRRPTLVSQRRVMSMQLQASKASMTSKTGISSKSSSFRKMNASVTQRKGNKESNQDKSKKRAQNDENARPGTSKQRADKDIEDKSGEDKAEEKDKNKDKDKDQGKERQEEKASRPTASAVVFKDANQNSPN